jgi:hypothetical protein
MFLIFLQKKISIFQRILETEQHRRANHSRLLLLAPKVSQNFSNIVVGKNNENYTYPEMSDISIFELLCRLRRHPLHLCAFKTPPKGAVITEQGGADCAL